MRRIAIPALVVALAGVQGCNGDDPATPGASTSESSPTSPSPTSTSPSPSAGTATGIRLSMPNSTVRAPEEWTRAADRTRYEDGADSPDNLAYIMLGEINAFGSDASAGELGENRLKANLYERAPKKLPVTELAGVPAYHIAGFVDARQYIEEFGAVVRDRIVTVTFSFNEKVPKSERDRVVAAVLPTFAWQ